MRVGAAIRSDCAERGKRQLHMFSARSDANRGPCYKLPMIKLYGQYRSRAFRVAWLCKEAGIEFEHVDVTINHEKARCKASWYQDLNPNARVPTIDDNGVVLWESAAINLYLAERYQSELWPKDLAARGRLLQWTFFVTSDIEPDMVAIRMHRQVLPEQRRSADLAAAAEERLPTKLAILECHLSENKFFGGDHWDLSDFMVASVCYTLLVMRYDLSQYPNFNRWLRVSLDRPKAREARRLRDDTEILAT